MAPRPLAMVMAMALLAISSGIKGRPSKVKTRFKALSKVPEMGARNPPRAARFGGGRLAMGRAAVAAAAAAAAEAQRGGSPRRAARHTSGVAEAPSGRRKRDEE